MTFLVIPSRSHALALFCIGLFPQVQMVALCNSRAMGESHKNSDIDLFVIAQSDRLWTARFIITVIASIFAVRRRNTHGLTKGTPEYIRRTKDRFCLSFFVTEDAMNLETIRLQPDDPYIDKWISTLIPLVNKHTTYERFMEANGVQKQKAKSRKQKEGLFIKISFFILSFFSLFEGLIKRIWLRKTLITYEKLGKPWGVVISDTMLKFHDNDQRIIFRNTLNGSS